MPSNNLNKGSASLLDHFTEHWQALALVAPLFYIAFVLWTVYGSNLRKLPGPFIARFTRMYLFSQSLKGNAHSLYLDLHRKHGKIVRIGPNIVSISDPEMIPIIYGISSKYNKSAFYDVFTATHKGKIHENIFASRNQNWHKAMRTTIAQAYSLSSLRQLEPLVDECSILFMDAMKDLAGKPLDLGEWLQWYAFDVIGNITFAQTFGFLKDREDRMKVIDGLEAGTKYNTVIGQVPELHPWLLGNESLMNLLMKIPALARANPITVLKKMTEDALTESENLDPERTRGDFLEFLRRAQKKDPKRMPDREMESALFTNLFAGSNTTATALTAIFYFLVKNPDKFRNLKDEIDHADKEGHFSEYVEFQQGSDLRYLQAVIKESMRLYPVVSYPLERIVPDGGAELCGVFLPGGTVVGMHAWVVNRDKGIFGEDAEDFRPERWIDVEPEQLKQMEHAFLSFGAGSRACLGKSISMLEMTKFVPQVLRHFDVEWASSEEEWDISGYWFAKQSGVVMRLNLKKN